MKQTGSLRQTIPLEAFVATGWTVPLQRSPIDGRPPLVVHLRATQSSRTSADVRAEARAEVRNRRAAGKGGRR